MNHLTRRSFLEHTLAASAAALAASSVRAQERQAEKPEPPAQPRLAPSDRIGLAVIGLHGRGMEHLQAYSHDAGAEIVALCDVDESTFGNAQRRLKDNGQPEAKTYQDLRKLLEDKAVQAVSIATPNHWHALAGVWAMQAGKDVYVEKPVSHNVSEGRRLEEARAKYGRVCQAGTQARSSAAHREAIQYIHDGNI